MSHPSPEPIAILDCGAQYTKVIDRRLRQLNVESVIYPIDVQASVLKEVGIKGIILSGGPHSVYDLGAPKCDGAIFDLDVPVLGICYGMQLMTQHFGGIVGSCARKEYGETEITVNTSSPLFTGLNPTQHVLMSHGDSVTQLGEGFVAIAESVSKEAGKTVNVHAGIAHQNKPFYGVQFHPEVELSTEGTAMLERFLFNICHLSGSFKLADRLETMLAELKAHVRDRPVFVLVSGGVDSSVVAAALIKALPAQQVYAVHINTGLMRQDESDLVCDALKAIGLTHLKRLDAQDFFLDFTTLDDTGRTIGPLKDATDPEEKRRLIGDAFFRLIDAEMKATLEEAGVSADDVLLAQGTLRPDLIESGNKDVSKTAQKIKTHHNDVPLIQAQRNKGLIVEPNRDLHKDEVRQVGRLLGLPEALVIRQPFPGPGLGVRMLCAKQAYGLEAYDSLNADLQEIACEFDLRAVLLPVRTVGVQGDGRTYSYVAAIEAEDFDSTDGFKAVRHAARELTNRLPLINRIALNILPSRSLPTAIKTITPTTLTPDALAQLQTWDAQVTSYTLAHADFNAISQLLAVMLPVAVDSVGTRSLAVRAVVTSDFMTARPAVVGQELPEGFLSGLGQHLAKCSGVGHVFYDVTSKPPATVEWE
jgi:GMP synthase (glutamine-hydrolysing)